MDTNMNCASLSHSLHQIESFNRVLEYPSIQFMEGVGHLNLLPHSGWQSAKAGISKSEAGVQGNHRELLFVTPHICVPPRRDFASQVVSSCWALYAASKGYLHLLTSSTKPHCSKRQACSVSWIIIKGLIYFTWISGKTFFNQWLLWISDLYINPGQQNQIRKISFSSEVNNNPEVLEVSYISSFRPDETVWTCWIAAWIKKDVMKFGIQFSSKS